MFLIVLLLVGCTQDESKVEEFRLPDLTNKTKEEVEEIFDDAPVTVVFKDIESIDVPKGLFIEYGNDLEANELVPYGSFIYICFSSGIEKIILPDLAGKSKLDIITIFENYNLVVSFNYVDSELKQDSFISYGEGFSIGMEVEENASIVVNISKEYVLLPNLMGKNKSEIESILSHFNISVDYRYQDSSSIGDDLFIKYDDGLEVGSKVYINSNITIIISKYINEINLPDLTGLTKSEIINRCDELDIICEFVLEETPLIDKDEFIRYRDYDINDRVNRNNTIYIVISKGPSIYFQVLDLYYDGPRIDPKYYNVDPINPRGGYFEVSLMSCIDGDTAKFDYPSFIEPYVSDGESVRFLNMDTEETYPNAEEWGFPAKFYTCDLLENAESIIIQTDPDDELQDHYGRLLSWIWIVPEGTELRENKTEYDIDQYELINYKIIQQGLARVAYLYGAGKMKYNNKSYTDWMYQAENYAKNNGLGQWGSLLDPYWDYKNNRPK